MSRRLREDQSGEESARSVELRWSSSPLVDPDEPDPTARKTRGNDSESSPPRVVITPKRMKLSAENTRRPTGRVAVGFRAFASPPRVARAARSSQLCSEGQPTTNAAAAAYRSTAHRAAGCTQRGAFTPGGRRTRGDLDDEARHSLLARHVVTDAHSSPLRVGPRHSRPSCPRGSRPRSERPRLAMQARRRGRVFGVRARALPLSAARPRCRPPARSARNRAAPCRCR